MKKPSTTSLVVSLIVMVSGITVLILGGRLFLSGAALADQTGNSGPMGAGVALMLAGLFLLFAPPATWVVRTFTDDYSRYSAWKRGLTPQERAAVNAAETAALAGAAVAGWEAGRAGARRVGERYAASAAASKVSDAAIMQQLQANGAPGWPGASVPAPGQPGSAAEPIPGQYQPTDSSWDQALQGVPYTDSI